MKRVLAFLLVSNEPSFLFNFATKKVGNFCEVKALMSWNFLCLVEVGDTGFARARLGKDVF